MPFKIQIRKIVIGADQALQSVEGEFKTEEFVIITNNFFQVSIALKIQGRKFIITAGNILQCIVLNDFQIRQFVVVTLQGVEFLVSYDAK